MRLNQELLAEADRAGALLAGSLLAWPEAERLKVAVELVQQGKGIHADVFDGSFPRNDGVRSNQLDRLARSHGERLDVHLMVARPVDILSSLPASPFSRLTVHMTPGNSLCPLQPTGARSLWLSIEPNAWGGRGQADLLKRVLDLHLPDGVIIMLTPPGAQDARANLSALQSPPWLQAAARGPVGVDGGVTCGNLRTVLAAGATYVVAGRALSSRTHAVSRWLPTTNGER